MKVKNNEHVDTESSHNESELLVTILVVLVSAAALVVGFEVGTTDGLVSSLSFTQRYGQIVGVTLGIVVSAFNLGEVCGCISVLFAFRLRSDTLIKVGYGVYAAGVLFQILTSILAYDFLWCLVAYRVTLGISGGIFILICPIYITQITIDPTRRGQYLSLIQLWLCGGIMLGSGLSIAIDPFILQYCGNCGICLLGSVSCWLLTPIDPISSSSLRYLAEIKQEEQKAIIEPQPLMNPQKELRPQEDTSEQDSNMPLTGNGSPFRWRKLGFCVTLMVFQQLTGINFFFYYSKRIVGDQPWPLVLASVNLAGSIASFKMVKWFDRLFLLQMGSGTLTALLCSYWACESSIVVYAIVVVFSVSWGPVSGIVINELANANKQVLTISISANFAFSFLVVNISPVLMSIMGLNLLWCFVGAMIVSLAFLMVVPETKHLSNTEIEELFSNGGPSSCAPAFEEKHSNVV
ncbi:hexose transporter [Yamadazyma tenuis]|uniref:MFS general substrate transporter n=1 Tax=Candida tenuis (strain ATCC 10573 / BCRC 21748 / CBS 615 / JCM 9827 / NBRC 10315 / NRRL Y-1498 / VKM Y-70) TaxID=590646 RepID=G3AYR2_CANTC|nr:MFS general substrate transporter [Yamadazyma tenuis ATCC 10573]EGV65908.1 MFS general substrate transporter [Yamadazyma tenuis ATCC 10573]WEJ95760.1 hexose transporter [Yamadazyma tenuis]